jgi:hypothetical protein
MPAGLFADLVGRWLFQASGSWYRLNNNNLTFVLIALTHELIILTWINNQAATIPNAKAWGIVVHPPSWFRLVMSGNVVEIHCLWIGVLAQLHWGKVWRGGSNTFDYRIEECWLCLGHRFFVVGRDAIMAWVLYGGIRGALSPLSSSSNLYRLTCTFASAWNETLINFHIRSMIQAE